MMCLEAHYHPNVFSKNKENAILLLTILSFIAETCPRDVNLYLTIFWAIFLKHLNYGRSQQNIKHLGLLSDPSVGLSRKCLSIDSRDGREKREREKGPSRIWTRTAVSRSQPMSVISVICQLPLGMPSRAFRARDEKLRSLTETLRFSNCICLLSASV